MVASDHGPRRRLVPQFPIAVAIALCVAASGLPAARQQPAATPSTQVVFRDIAATAGLGVTHVNGASPDKYFAEIMGSGGLFFDFDNDGWTDVFLVDGGSVADPRVAATARHRLFRNRRNSTFEDVTAASGIRHRDYGMGACAGDYDNDGAVDLYITNYGANLLYRNAGDGRFHEVPGAGGAGTALWSTSCAFTDVDKDGYLDLFVTNYVQAERKDNKFCGRDTPPRLRGYCSPLAFRPSTSVLYRNTGKGSFDDISTKAGIAAYRGNGLGVAVTDVDEDGWPDVFVANDQVPNFLFRNKGNGTFEEVGLLSGVSVAADGKARAGMGTAFGDYDGDGRLDLVVTNHEFEMHSLFRNLGGGVFTDVTLESGLGPLTLPYVGFGVAFLDFDNDTRRDLAIVNGNVVDNIAEFRKGAKHAQPKLLLRNVGSRFRNAGAQPGSGFAVETVGRALAKGDIDNDGDVDLLITNNGGAVQLLQNDGGNRNNAIDVRVVGGSTSLTTSTKSPSTSLRASNRDGIGARLRLTVGAQTLVDYVTSGSSYLAQHDVRVHFGLGSAIRADRLEIRWPSGQIDVMENLPANHVITIREGEEKTDRVPFAR
jgi:enediyne biosynthesis protein E4